MKLCLSLVVLLGMSSCSTLFRPEPDPVEDYIEKMKRSREISAPSEVRYIVLPVPTPRS